SERWLGVDVIGEAHLGTRLEGDVRRERDLDRRRLVERHTPELTAVEGHDRFRVRREGVAGNHIHWRGALLIIALDRIDEPRLFTGREITKSETGLRLVSRSIDEPLAVGGERRPEGRAETRRHRRGRAGLTIVDAELVLWEHGVVLPVALPRGEPHVARI